MFTKTLLPDTLRAIQLVSNIPTVANAYLAGGTALAMHLGHRISVDLDFFTQTEFNEHSLLLELEKTSNFVEEGSSWQTVWGKIGQTKFSLFYYQYPLIEEPAQYENIRLSGKKDIAAMKIHALEERGTRRDFIDVYFLAKEYTLENMLSFYNQKFGKLTDHLYSILRSLSYFEDAENEKLMPKMIEPIKWEKVKDFFASESKRLWQKHQ